MDANEEEAKAEALADYVRAALAGRPLPILKLSKNRNGVIGRPVELRFNGALQRYREV